MRNSAIEWTDHTFNPWVGCTKVSDGCKHCYAEALMDKRFGRVEWGVNGTRKRTSAANWRDPLKWNRDAQAAGIRQRVFCASLADVFEDRPELAEWRSDLFDLIYSTPHLDWLLLTKRPENVLDMVPANWHAWLPANVWIGTSIENQAAADERIPHLLRIPASVRFLSMEPLLGPVDLDHVVSPGSLETLRGVQWVIVGGESGTKARPMHPDWVRSIRDQCQADGVPFFFKQWGEWWPHEQSQWVTDAERFVGHDTPTDDYYKIGKHNAGRTLDGREWQQYP